MPVLQILVIAFTVWFGLYLIAQHSRKVGLLYAGLGLLTYGLGLALNLLSTFSPESNWVQVIDRHQSFLLLFPALFWLGAMIHLLPPRRSHQNLLRFAWFVAIVDVVAIIAFQMDELLSIIGFVPLLFALIALYFVWRAYRQSTLKRPLITLLTAGIFFALAISLLVIPNEWQLNELVLIAVSGDLIALGYIIAALDAYDAGEIIFPDFLRSLGASTLVAIILGGQVVLMMVIQQDFSLPMQFLLLLIVISGIALQVFSQQLQRIFDMLVFRRQATVQAERETLQDVSDALVRANPELSPVKLDDEEFIRLTRRALSQMSDFSRLASSPLIRLPIIDQRIQNRNGADHTLERVTELREVLIESIERLKPLQQEGATTTTDEWRYYNALYYPYVLGVKPYSRRLLLDEYDAETRTVLDWFRVQVPERTLYNWQNTAAKLIAQDLREQNPEEILNSLVG